MDQKQGIRGSADFSASKSEQMDAQDNSSTSNQVEKPSDEMGHVLYDFTDMISIRVKDKYFGVPRDLLAANSTFFDDALNYSDPKKFFLVLDDIDKDIFNLFINVLLESSLWKKYKIPRSMAPSPGPTGTTLLRLWKLSRRFNNHRVCRLVEEALKTYYFDTVTPKKWETIYINNTDSCVCQILLWLQECYSLCKDELIPFEKEFVLACSNCPGQVVVAHFEYLEPGFKTEVVKGFAARVADPNLAQRKRSHDEDECEPKASNKRRC